MVTHSEYKFVWYMLKIGAFAQHNNMWQPQIYARFGFKWILKWLKNRQVVDDLHHAPACAANHYHKQRLIFGSCKCGAAYYAQQEAKELSSRISLNNWKQKT